MVPTPNAGTVTPGGRAGRNVKWLRGRLEADGDDVDLPMAMQDRVMAKLIYVSNMSLDGCTEDEHGAFDWAPPDHDVFAFITKLMRPAGTVRNEPPASRPRCRAHSA